MGQNQCRKIGRDRGFRSTLLYYPASRVGLFLSIFLIVAVMFLPLFKCLAQIEGLGFYSHETNYENRTALDLSPDGHFEFNMDFSLSFDIRLTDNNNQFFGYVFRIISNDSINIDLLVKKEGAKTKIMIVNGDSESDIRLDLLQENLLKSWSNICVDFNLSTNDITLRYDTITMRHEGLSLRQDDKLKVLFGANRYLQYATTDLPPMNLKRIKLSQNDKPVYYWPLNEGIGTNAYDEIEGSRAHVVNPRWHAQKHQTWVLQKTLNLPGPVLPAFNKEDNVIYLAGNDSMAIVDPNQNSIAYTAYTAYSDSNLEYKVGDRAIYDPTQHRLLVYDISHSQNMHEYDFRSKKWSGNYRGSQIITEHWHHNNFISHTTNKLYLIGGYGQHTFKNTIYSYDLSNEGWSQLAPDQAEFPPRSLSGLASTQAGDSVYIVGGYGSRKGNQLLRPEFFYDVHLFVPKKEHLEKVSTLNLQGSEYCFANKIVMDSLKNFYGLVYNKNKFNSRIKLVKFSLANPEVEVLADSIPYSFHDIRSYADLYFSQVDKKLYTLTSFYNDKTESTEVNIYSLNFPPISTILAPSRSNNYWYLLVMAIAIAIAVVYYTKTRRSKETPGLPLADELEPIQKTAFQKPEKIKNSILLFGGFQVFDKNGTEITGKITPLQKELFLVVLMTTLRYGKGISSERLDELFWFDKSKIKARNNRSVNISKINSVFIDLDGCNFNLNNGSWMIDINHDSVYVDYFEYLQLINSGDVTAEFINRLTDLVKGGALLPNSNYEWLDDYKGDSSNKIIDKLLNFTSGPDVMKNHNLIVNLANVIFTFDPINEDALNLQCQALVKLGKHSLAEKTYKRFIKEYKTIYDEDYSISMGELIKDVK
ncbi:MAG: kelch repeat-containing protein [Cyclobacteriaceae bacterium]